MLSQTLVSRKRVQNFNKNYQSRWQLELVKIFNFSDKIPGFSKTMKLCLNFHTVFCITLLVLPNYKKKKKKSVHKPQFYINHASHLNCDTFHSFSFPFICYFFKTGVQNYSPELCECHKKTPVLMFFLKKQRLQVFKKGHHQSFFPVKFAKFFRTVFFQNNFRRMFLFRWLALRSPIIAIRI